MNAYLTQFLKTCFLGMLSCYLLFIAPMASAAPDAEPTDKEADQQTKAVPVTIATTIKTNMLSTSSIRGEVESFNAPHIAAKVSAEVMDIKVDEGMTVKSGQLLAVLDDEAFKIAVDGAKADIQRLNVLIRNQLRNYKRNKALGNKKLISQATVDETETLLKESQASLISAKSMLRKARYQLSHARIHSPVNGVIQQRMISKGDYVNLGETLLHIVATEKLRARLYFPETLANTIHTSMNVKLMQGRQSVKGKISRLRPMLEAGNRALHALVDFENIYHWKPGSSITATVVLKKQSNAIAIPQKALVRRPAGLVVYLVTDNRVKEQLVTTGLKQDQLVEIKSGLNEGDVVVLDGAAWLSNGSVIAIQESPQ